MPIHAVDHVQLPIPLTPNAEEHAQQFYSELLQLPRNTDASLAKLGTLRFDIGTQRLDLTQVADFNTHPAAHLALTVTRLWEVLARLRSADVAIDDSKPLPQHQRVYVTDPFGHVLELIEPLTRARAAEEVAQ